jgi:hypothetical protein
MSHNIEQIEAKLCAYIDGMLDEAETLEIERYLAASPAHQQLIAQLKQTRDLVAQLPRERAPAEVNEILQGQLERSVLLTDQPDDRPNIILRIGRRPQFLAAAAIVLLAAGLAFLVFQILPHDTPTVVVSPQPSGPVAIKEGLAEGELRQEMRPEAAVARRPARPTTPDAEAKSDPMREQAGQVDKLALADPASPLAKNLEVLHKLGMPAEWCEAMEVAAAAPSNDSGLFLVHTDNVAQARDQLVTFLSSNNIAWSYDGDALGRAKFDRANTELALAEATAGRLRADGGRAFDQPNAATGATLTPPADGSGAPFGAKSAAGPSPGNAKDAQAGNDAPRTHADAVAPAPKTRGTAVANEDTHSALPARIAAPATAPARAMDQDAFAKSEVVTLPATRPAIASPGQASQATDGRAVIVARNLNQSQLEQLTNTLAQQDRAEIRAYRQPSLARKYKAESLRPGLLRADLDPTKPIAAEALAPKAGEGGPGGGGAGGWKSDDAKLGARDEATREKKSPDTQPAEPRLQAGSATTGPATSPAKPALLKDSLARELRYDCVIVLESPPPADGKTGKTSAEQK